MTTRRRVSPGGVIADVPVVPDHDHELSNGQGGDLKDYLRLSRETAQTVTGDVTFSGAVLAASFEVAGTLDTGSQVNVSYLVFADGGVISWQSGSYSMTIVGPSLTANRNLVVPDEGGTLLTNTGGSPVRVARNYRQTAQAAAIASFNLLTAPTPGSYRVSAYIETTAETVAGTYTVPIGYTDAVGATSQNVINAIAVTGTGRTIGTPILIEVASGNVTAEVQIGLFTGTYNVRIVAERLP